jgi:hypothetical protein
MVIKQKNTFAITASQAYQNPYSAMMYGENKKAGEPNYGFLECFDKYCKDKSAESIIQAIRGSYVNEIELHNYFRNRKQDVFMECSGYKRLISERKREITKRQKWEDYIIRHENIQKDMPMHYFWEEIPNHEYNLLDILRINQKISLIEPVTPPQNEDPVSGNRDLPQDYLGVSVIMPHSKQRLVSIPKDLGGKLPRVLLSTGCCTYPNYNETNSRGKKAKRHHQYGFVAIDIINNVNYIPRLVPALSDGTFIDLGMKYAPGKDPEKVRAKALVLGDIHVPFQDSASIKASYEMIKELEPEKIFLHDLLDFYCINHHEYDNPLWRMKVAEKGLDSLVYELKKGIEFLNEISDIATGKIYVVPSNHDRFVQDWINSGKILKDPKNMRIGAGIISKYTTKKSISQIALEQVGKIPKNIEFLLLNEDQRPHNYECSAHGHKGIDGARGTLKQFKVSYGKVITGHTHTLEVDGHAISAGTNSRIPLEYQKGQPSKAMAGNVAIYEPSLAQAIPIIRGKWRKK